MIKKVFKVSLFFGFVFLFSIFLFSHAQNTSEIADGLFQKIDKGISSKIEGKNISEQKRLINKIISQVKINSSDSKRATQIRGAVVDTISNKYKDVLNSSLSPKSSLIIKNTVTKDTTAKNINTPINGRNTLLIRKITNKVGGPGSLKNIQTKTQSCQGTLPDNSVIFGASTFTQTLVNNTWVPDQTLNMYKRHLQIGNNNSPCTFQCNDGYLYSPKMENGVLTQYCVEESTSNETERNLPCEGNIPTHAVNFSTSSTYRLALQYATLQNGVWVGGTWTKITDNLLPGDPNYSTTSPVNRRHAYAHQKNFSNHETLLIAGNYFVRGICNFVCEPGYLWDKNTQSCAETPNAKIATCGGNLPAHAVSSIGSNMFIQKYQIDYRQSWLGQIWTPQANRTFGETDGMWAEIDTLCKFVCSVGYVLNNGSCIVLSLPNNLQGIQLSGAGYYLVPNTDKTPRVMFYKEKINKHINTTNGQREIDPDGYANGLSACTDPNTETCQLENPNRWGKKKLEYCKRFYPDTVSIRPFAWEKSIRWIPQRANNANSGPYLTGVGWMQGNRFVQRMSYEGIRMSYECVQP